MIVEIQIIVIIISVINSFVWFWFLITLIKNAFCRYYAFKKEYHCLPCIEKQNIINHYEKGLEEEEEEEEEEENNS